MLEKNESAQAQVKNAAHDVVELVRAEIGVAKAELRTDLGVVKASAQTLGVAAALGLVGVELVLGAVVVAGRRHPATLLLVGLGCLVGAVAFASLVRDVAPDVLAVTRSRVADDVDILKERLT